MTMAKDFYQQYIEQLLSKAGLIDEGEEVDKEYAGKLGEELKKRVGLMIMDALPKDKLEAYTELVHKTLSSDEIFSFLKENINDFEAKRVKVIEDFAVNFLERTTKMREALK